MKVFCNSIPKCGSYLLLRAVRLFKKMGDYGTIQKKANKIAAIRSMPENYLMFGHQHNNQKILTTLVNNSIVVLFIMRDPRDMIVSRYHFEKTDKMFNRFNKFHTISKEEAYNTIMRSVLGGTNGNTPRRFNIAEYIASFSQYYNHEKVLTVRFEDLIGPKGGGDASAQRAALVKIKKAISSSVSVDKVAPQMFSVKAETFRKGQINQWKYEFTAANSKLFRSMAGKWLERLGYE